MPSAIGANGRGPDGRFRKGNPGGPGNPHARQVARLRAALLEAITPEDIAAVVRAMIERACAGDVAAAKVILERALGQPIQADLVERIEALEALFDAEQQTAATGTARWSRLCGRGEESVGV